MGLTNWASVASSLLSNRPSYLIFQITSRCNSRCSTCFNWKQTDADTKNELSFDEIEKISENYGRLLQLTLGGGEPFLRKDISEICKLFNKNCSVQNITIPTNCLQPEFTKKAVEKILSECDINYLKIGLSLDGIGEEHDRIRNVPGNYEKVLETYRCLVDLKKKYVNLGIDIGSVLSAFNKETIFDTIKEVPRIFPKMDKHAICMIRGDAREKKTKDVGIEDYRAVMNRLKHRSPNNIVDRIFKTMFSMNMEIVSEYLKTGKMSIQCVAGKRLLVLLPEGTVYPCEMLDQPFGNLKDYNYDMGQILKTAEAKKSIKFISEKKCACSWECAIHASLVFNRRNFCRLFYNSLLS